MFQSPEPSHMLLTHQELTIKNKRIIQNGEYMLSL